MNWYLEATGLPGTRVELLPDSGNIKVDQLQRTVVRDHLDGSRRVRKFPVGPPTPTIPVLVFFNELEMRRLKNLCFSGMPLTLGTDTGSTYSVAAVDNVPHEELDTPDRGSHPIFYVTLNLVGVS